jgi:hypothetical protein
MTPPPEDPPPPKSADPTNDAASPVAPVPPAGPLEYRFRERKAASAGCLIGSSFVAAGIGLSWAAGTLLLLSFSPLWGAISFGAALAIVAGFIFAARMGLNSALAILLASLAIGLLLIGICGTALNS